MTTAFDHLLALAPFGTPAEEKRTALLAAMAEAIRHHAQACPPYRRFLDRRGFDPAAPLKDLADIPYLPSAIFKTMQLSSVAQDKVVRTLTSSGTSSQIPSRVALDDVTRTRQVKALAMVLKHVIGPERRPFLVLDAAPSSAADTGQQELSARAAGMRGYLLAASEVTYVLEERAGVPTLSRERLATQVARLAATGKPFCLIGYTFVLYQHVILPLLREGMVQLPDNAFLMHFGGWKRLADAAVSRDVFMERLGQALGIEPHRVSNIYGFTEQLGVIYPDDSRGIKRAPVFSEIIVRDPVTLRPVADGESGLLEFITPLPHSYPGVAIMLDDMGRIVSREPGEDGRSGTGFEVLGRAAEAEVRGCGDTLPDRVYEVST
jgi:hypothetical protein